MTPTYSFRLATAADDAPLRALLREVSMPGAMALTSPREPDFFRAERLGNLASQVIVCSGEDGRLAGFGIRAMREAYVDGEVRRVAYLSTLRSYPHVRHGRLLARAYAYLRALDAADPVAASVTTIYDDNAIARAILTSGRAGLPGYHALGGLRTYAIGLRRSRRATHASASAGAIGADALAAALNRHNAAWPFAPHWRAEDFADAPGRCEGLRLADVRVRCGRGGVRASLGTWDVSSLRQNVVARYAWPLGAYQRVSALADVLGLGPALPRAGAPIRLLDACAASLADDAPVGEFAILLDDVIARVAGRDHDFLLLGLPAGHRLEPLAAARASLVLKSTVYEVSWGAPLVAGHATRPPFLELATL